MKKYKIAKYFDDHFEYYINHECEDVIYNTKEEAEKVMYSLRESVYTSYQVVEVEE